MLIILTMWHFCRWRCQRYFILSLIVILHQCWYHIKIILRLVNFGRLWPLLVSQYQSVNRPSFSSLYITLPWDLLYLVHTSHLAHIQTVRWSGGQIRPQYRLKVEQDKMWRTFLFSLMVRNRFIIVSSIRPNLHRHIYTENTRHHSR